MGKKKEKKGKVIKLNPDFKSKKQLKEEAELIKRFHSLSDHLD